ncbi:MAG: ABC transporter substrate-binding protein [Petrotogales bacterium]
MKRLFVVFLVSCFLIAGSVTLAASEDELIVYHWWTAGGEKEAIDALFEAFLEEHPDVEIVENPVAGGGGGIMRAQIKTMIMAGNPPDTFQITYGHGMIRSFASVLQPIDNLIKGYNIPEAVYEWGRVDGEMYGVPLNLMQNNCLWYNVDLVEELGIEMPIESINDFLNVCSEIKEAGYVPLAVGAGMGQKFWLGTLFEAINSSLPGGGSDFLNEYYAGNIMPSESSVFKNTLQVMKTLIDNDFINDDFSALTWDQAGDLMATGKAVFYVMGDWGKGHFTAMGLEPRVDFGYQPFPGTSDTFVGHADCFVLPVGVDKQLAKDWIKFLTTVKAANTFCPIKGASPFVLDAPLEVYDSITKEILGYFRDEDVSKVLSQFGAPPESYLDVFGTAFSQFFNNPVINEKSLAEFDYAYEEVFWY